MKKIYYLTILYLFLASTALADIQRQSTIDPAKEKKIKSRIGSLQIPFIKNESQIKDPKVKFYANTFAGTVFVKDNEIVYGLKGWAIRERFLNAKRTKAEGIDASETKVSYFKGSNQSSWKSNIPTYKEISLGEIYKNIHLNLKAYGKNVEKLFIVEKGGKPEDIAIRVEGAKGLKVNEQGELEIETGMGTVKITKPVAYQEIDRKRVEVAAFYNPDVFDFTYCFKVGEYNKNYPLIIDPLLASTCIGGSESDYAYALATDSQGNFFVAGFTRSFPTTPGAYDTSYNGGNDVFVSKLNSSLTSLIASTFIGGSSDEIAYALAIDSQGNVFVAGDTSSYNYPVTPNSYDTSYNGGHDVFVSKLNSSLTSLIASTFVGGSNQDSAAALAIDSQGNVFVGGSTESYNYPITPNSYDTSFNGGGGNYDGFVSKLNSSLTSLIASTFIGGNSSSDSANALATDSQGNVFVAGSTGSSDFPTTLGAHDTSYNGGHDVFVSKLNSSLTSHIASTFIGGNFEEYTYALTIDSQGNVFVAGSTGSSDFPTTPGAYDTSLNGNYDAFVSKLNSSLTSLIASTFIGGSDWEYWECAYALAIDSQGNVFVAGGTLSPDFPTTPGAYDTSFNGGEDVFISKLNSSLTSLIASTFIGGNFHEYAYALAIDSQGNVFVAGRTLSSDFPTTPNAYNTSCIGGGDDAFIVKLDTNLSEYPDCTYSIDPHEQSFSPNGGSGSTTVTTNKEDCTWTAKSNNSWITITSTSGGTGTGWVVFWVDPNLSSSSRTGTLTIADQTLTVTQEGSIPSECSTWTEVIDKYNTYLSGQANWTDVIECYNQYVSPSP